MLEATELIAVACLLIAASPEGAPSQAQLRRAISTAYYALFHATSRKGAECFVGTASADMGAFERCYRAFDHGLMIKVCEGIVRERTQSLKQVLGGSNPSFSEHLLEVADTFCELLKRRISADYDPCVQFPSSVAEDLIARADLAVLTLEGFSIEGPEMTVMLASMLFRPRP